MYYPAFFPVVSRTPQYGTYISIGPDLTVNHNVTWARLEIFLPQNRMTFELAFTFTRVQDYFVNLVLPYFVTYSRAGIGPNFITDAETYLETASGGYKTSNNGSVVWLRYHPRFESLPSGSAWHARVGINIYVLEFERSHEPGVENFAVILFANYPRLPDSLFQDLHPTGGLLTSSNFTLGISFDPRGELGGRTVPSPAAIFVSRWFKSAMWVLNFQISENRGQAVQLSIEYPGELQTRDLRIFLSGLLVAFGLSVLLEFVSRKPNCKSKALQVENLPNG